MISSAPAIVFEHMAVEPLDATGVFLCVISAILVATLAYLVERVSVNASSHQKIDESSPLKGSDNEDSDSFQVVMASLGGSVLLLAFSTGIAAYAGQLAPLATTAVCISVMFTVRPVICATPWLCLSKAISLDMASVPWLCVLWQIALTAMPMRIVAYGILGRPDGKLMPWTMLVTFIGAVYLCISLETTGCLGACARKIASAFGRSPPMLYFCFSLLSACMTCLIPDDVVTMTLAPTVCLLCASLRIDAEPHLYGTFYCANIFAVTLVTGNITNVLVAEVTGDSFMSFARKMAVPGIVGGIAAVMFLYLALTSVLHKPVGTFEPRRASTAISSGDNSVRYPVRAIVCLVRLVFTFTFAALDEWHHWPIWMTLAVFAGASLFIDLIMDVIRVDGSSNHTKETVLSLPYSIFFFFPALFVLVQQLLHVGVVDFLASGLGSFVHTPFSAMMLVGFLSLFAAQAVSSAPMTILFVEVISRVPAWIDPPAGSDALLARDLSLYALVIGSNYCGNISRMGTMGGQLWFRIAGSHGIVLSDARMGLRGGYIMLPVLALTLCTLYFMI